MKTTTVKPISLGYRKVGSNDTFIPCMGVLKGLNLAQESIDDSAIESEFRDTHFDVIYRCEPVKIEFELANYSIGELAPLFGGLYHEAKKRMSEDEKNLLFESDTPITTSEYLIQKYKFKKAPEVGKTYQFTIHGRLGSGRHYFRLYNSSASCLIKTMTLETEIETARTWQGTSPWSTTDSRGNQVPNDELWVYQYPSDATGASTIEWIRMEELEEEQDDEYIEYYEGKSAESEWEWKMEFSHGQKSITICRGLTVGTIKKDDDGALNFSVIITSLIHENKYGKKIIYKIQGRQNDNEYPKVIGHKLILSPDSNTYVKGGVVYFSEDDDIEYKDKTIIIK